MHTWQRVPQMLGGNVAVVQEDMRVLKVIPFLTQIWFCRLLLAILFVLSNDMSSRGIGVGDGIICFALPCKARFLNFAFAKVLV
ncbi:MULTISPECIES: hypothetical protein [Nitrosomonas]|uniref:hypothetical protein n=1 Tax=Nitrosomonas TaxID=914 RepID=UPI0011874DCD|nr:MULTISPECIES: hypothetical protein [Nitrosomonas]UVS63210.1 hypothetical protein NX761_09035 [Nitrosomonas sp. PLL12]